MTAKTASETRLQSLSPDKARLVELLLERKQRQGRIRTYPRPATGPVRLPTSLPQQRLWFIDQLEGGGAAYNVPVALRVRGALDAHVLELALQALVRRHETLRTAFLNVEGDPQQEILPSIELKLQRYDVSVGSAQERERQVHTHKSEEASAPFDLRSGVPIRARLLRLAANEHVLLVTLHHIVSDGWSISVLIAELAELYAAIRDSRSVSLAPLPIQYGDYAQWQREWLQSSTFERQLLYWRERLAGMSPQLELPTDRPRPAVHRYRGGLAAVTLDERLTGKLNALARRRGMTLFMVLFASWAILLSRLSGQEDIAVGTPVANRGSPELEGLIGFFVNTLVLRVTVLADEPLHAFLDRVKEAATSAYDHQEMPFERLVEALRPERSLNRHPLFQAMFVLQNMPLSKPDLPGLDMTLEDSVIDTSKFDLLLSLGASAGRIAGAINYDADLFDRETVNRWIASYERLLQELTRDQNRNIGQLATLPESERQLLDALNATRAEIISPQLIHVLVEAQVARTPTAVAVEHRERSLTYAQLNSKANQLARFLRAQSVGSNQLVAICVERSLEMIIGLLGILKAGAAYLPLDPSYPAERLEQMLEDAAPSIVLTQARLQSILPKTSARVIELESTLNAIEGTPAGDQDPVALGLNGASLVYVIYTSGSTGRAKGTAMSHGAMSSLLQWHRAEFPSASPRVLQFAALSFDVAFQETLTTLSTGGTLILLDEWMRRDVRALMDLLASARVDRLFVPPLMLQTLAEQASAEDADKLCLRDVITAGEQLRIDASTAKFFVRLRHCRLHNHYGPTETHVVTALTLPRDSSSWPALPNIGSPIANTQIHILDRRRQQVPLGVVGEIYIGGANLANGYLHRPELTAERFVTDPFSAVPNARMYKTGDLGRWRTDGTIEYLGRNDDQVKIRGYRIELGEIETQLARHPNVREAAVVMREDNAGEKRLIGYVTMRDEVPTVESLRTFLSSLMPEYMVPSVFMVLEALPLTPSGKLNRRALPLPDLQSQMNASYEAPQGDVEERLAQVWQALLGLSRVGRHDNFFELGGHSLLVLKALFRIEQLFGRALQVSDVYHSPTLARLAARIGGGAAHDPLVDLAREAILSDDVVALDGVPLTPAKNLFVTGATGFLGRFLLAQLLQQEGTTLYCLVRARSRHEANERLRTSLLKWDLWNDDTERRVVAIPGDLRTARLGIDNPTMQMLADVVDCIYHCATSMNHLETYSMAKAANVDAARELLRLATQNRPKLLNYVSTLGVFSADTGTSRVVNERTSIDRERHPHSRGYVASKWVAEKLFLLAGERGIPCNIFRVGLVWADTKRGRYDELQRGYRIIKSSLLAGCGIADYKFESPPLPVDYVARAIVHLAQRHAKGQGVFHISAPRQDVEDVFGACQQVLATPLRLLPFYDWIGEIKRLHYAGRSLPVVPLVEFAFSMDESSFAALMERHLSMEIKVNCDATLNELTSAGLNVPVLDESLVRLCVQDMLLRDEQLRDESASPAELFAPRVARS